MIKIAPSILSADFANLGAAVDELKGWGADMVHLDVMDGHFVDSITFGHHMCNALRKHTTLPFDVHLMVENPIKYIYPFKSAGADIFTFHIEADRHAHRTIQEIHKHNMLAGVALNPSTPIEAVEYVLEDCDMILIMTVNPGAPAQKFIPTMLEKISRLSDMLADKGLNRDIEVDGGINPETAGLCIEAGANVLVAGNSVFSADDKKSMIRQLRREN